ncbi:50S ribosomal protein L28 [Hippea maritima]|uniref:Large ribosomal subunit protein bL28 n=1 Tax=Hippea maritima (strain ATCC 700847 / DSM 10411 / MH2) TaxID=760142 RepID=F2LVW8_HIPMA|nr:50S ribosomal protein L28 [Hippea maritima]AEA33902.1 50S ribosomal protein L28 [Hippea maritima DSM 10411]
MARRCEICGKRAQVGYKVSHSHIRTKKKWNPNIQRVKVYVDGKVKRMNVCTQCLKANKVEKAVR